jgi:hypothetical protein
MYLDRSSCTTHLADLRLALKRRQHRRCVRVCVCVRACVFVCVSVCQAGTEAPRVRVCGYLTDVEGNLDFFERYLSL